MAVSKTQVDKAGAAMRDWWFRPNTPKVGDDERAALAVIWEYRRRFHYPTTMVASGLRYYTGKAGVDFIVTQRWKRLPRIVEKMARHTKMRLSQMQDVGGCRAILPDQFSVNQVLEGIQKNWQIITTDDYVTTPRPTGYRAVHVIVEKQDLPIEVQLRTQGQQDWADEVERIDGQVDYALKDGEGPDEVLEYTRLLAEVIYCQECGQPVDGATILQLNERARRVP